MTRLDYISGAVLLLGAALLFRETRQLTVWGPFGPSSGFFPLGLSALLAILSAVIIVRAWMQSEKTRAVPRILGPNPTKYFLYLVSFFAFSLVFHRVGYTLTLIAFLTFTLRAVEQQSWKTTVAVIVIAAAVSHFVFVRALSVPLPEGFLAPILRPM